MNKILKTCILSICILLSISIYNYANGDSYLYLNNLEFDVTVNTDGSMDVIETWNIRVEDTNTLFKAFEKDSSKYTKITNGKVSRINKNGKEEIFTNTNKYSYHLDEGTYYFLDRGNEYEIAWGTGKENNAGNETYVISYHVEGAVGKYKDCSEIYWQFIGNGFEIPARKITGVIHLPNGINSKEDIRVWGHSEDLNGTIYATSNNTVKFTVNDNKENNMIEIRIAIPPNVITYSNRTYNKNKLDEIIKEETKWADEANKPMNVASTIVNIAYGIVITVLAIYTLNYIKIIIKNKNKKPSMYLQYYRELPNINSTPGEALFILDNQNKNLDGKDFGKLFSASILNLSLKNAIKLEKIIYQNGREDTVIKILVQDIKNVNGYEEDIEVFEYIKKACQNKIKNYTMDFNMATNNNTSITINDLKRYMEVNKDELISLKTRMDDIISAKLRYMNYLDENAIIKKKKIANNKQAIFMLIFIGILTIYGIGKMFEEIAVPPFYYITIFIMLAVVLFLRYFAKKSINVFNQAGLDEKEKWKAFKKYMEDFSLLHEKSIPDLILWEKYLVYATAFGIADKVLQGLKSVYPNYSNVDFSTYNSVNVIVRTDFSRNLKTHRNYGSSSRSRSYSSGSGSGGGFSSGGGRRWRPAVEVEEDNFFQV